MNSRRLSATDDELHGVRVACRRITVAVTTGLVLLSDLVEGAELAKLIAHWPLVNDTRDALGAMHGTAFNLSNDLPLLIGFGAQNYVTGWLSDVRLYDGALDADALAKIRR